MPFRVALTFDAEHPDRPRCRPGVAEAILDRLAADGVRATFFMQGRWVEAYPGLARSVAVAGHLVGSHSHYHARMPLLSDDGLATDVGDAQRAIAEIVGVDPRPWFRCPFGAGHDDQRVLATLARLGYDAIGWDVEAFDWDPALDAKSIATTIVEGASAFGDRAIVLLHSWPESTGDAIGPIVARLRDRGATFVGIDDLRAPNADRP